MDKYTQGRLSRQVSRVQKCRRQMVEDQDLCLTALLPKEHVEAAVERHHVHFRQCLYTPVVTLWTFLYQVLATDQSCRAAVARLLAFLCVRGHGAGSAKTDPYCKARQRIPEDVVADLARTSGSELQHQVPPTGLLGGRPIQIVDGPAGHTRKSEGLSTATGTEERPGLSDPTFGRLDQSVLWRGAGRGHGAI